MSTSAAIADSLLRGAFGWQARHSPHRRIVQVRLGISRLRMPRLATRFRDEPS